WLAAQLSHDHDLWNRQWVIRQLATRTTDTVAAKAVAWAATGADYFLNRIDAIGVLGKFPPDVAVPARERSLKDTSAQVRRGAVGVFRQMRPDVAIPKPEAAQASLTHDDTRTAVRLAIEALRVRAGR